MGGMSDDQIPRAVWVEDALDGPNSTDAVVMTRDSSTKYASCPRRSGCFGAGDAPEDRR